MLPIIRTDPPVFHLAFYKGRKSDNPDTTILDQTICCLTDSPYSHVELIYNLNAYCMADCVSSSPRDKGVRYTSIDTRSDHWLIVPYYLDKTVDDMHQFFSDKIGKKYDYFGAVGAVVPIFSGVPNRWFCSEVIAAFDGRFKKAPTPGELFKFAILGV